MATQSSASASGQVLEIRDVPAQLLDPESAATPPATAGSPAHGWVTATIARTEMKVDPEARPVVSCRLATWRDVRSLVRFYMGLSEKASALYHPFPRNRAALFLIYATLVLWQSWFKGSMRRDPALIRGIMVARVAGERSIAGICTMRGDFDPELGWCIRMGNATADGYRGLGIAQRLLRAISVIAVGYGIRWQIGGCFVSNTGLIGMYAAMGGQFAPTDYRDPKMPNEPRYAARLDMIQFLQRPDPYASTTPVVG